MKILITTDTHIGHQKLIDKGYRPKDFEDKIISGLKGQRADLLIHLGDVVMGEDNMNHLRLMRELMTVSHRRVLVRGNHDKKSDKWYLDRGWGMVCDCFMNTYFGKDIIFTHVPLDVEFDSAAINIHGHLHGNDHRDDDCKDYYNEDHHKQIALENTDYKPVDLKKFLDNL